MAYKQGMVGIGVLNHEVSWKNTASLGFTTTKNTYDSAFSDESKANNSLYIYCVV
jgi:hypothetical protein